MFVIMQNYSDEKKKKVSLFFPLLSFYGFLPGIITTHHSPCYASPPILVVNKSPLSLPPVLPQNQAIDYVDGMGAWRATSQQRRYSILSFPEQLVDKLTPLSQTPCIMAKTMTDSTGFEPHGLEP